MGAILSAVPFACSSSAELSAAGGPCAVVTDCQEGLVCCNNGSDGKKATLMCAPMVTCLQPAGSGTPMPVPGDDAAAANGDGSIPNGDGSTAAEPPETGAPTEAGAPRESGSPPIDAGKPPVEDAGREASAPPPPVDSGMVLPDAAGD